MASFTASAATYNVKYIEIRNNNTGTINKSHSLAISRVQGMNGSTDRYFNSAKSSRASWNNTATFNASKAIDYTNQTLYLDALGNHTKKGADRTFLTLTYTNETAIDKLMVWGPLNRPKWANYDIRFFNVAGTLVHTAFLDMRTTTHNYKLLDFTAPTPSPMLIPVPAAFFLFAPALLGVLGLRRSARKAKLA